ncbi:putative cytoplasmic protein [Acetobacter nitrogenifigens DSM 23921 = NBRC 105050]|uniref:DUF2239 domain-containing protein n=1 Tax=Acetobacter nitrogenifigens DSM 23921 = NBRC 105050 TaxID=1120919 RepID=A0A511XEZ5_9PROT|nr:DUF2239 family protein [Acetobacter nitrogenifigens]GBQ94690.1 putative cytoplasmic protein [Acetobacter nitrogenifigens DSM 23921 = NBRC 105050]GEN61534.1 hypothetical protein ANI02nite_34180 [Acetobacter nitrogenifigens DSM 23921 = NBRC 105050]
MGERPEIGDVVVFAGTQRIGAGPLAAVLVALKQAEEQGNGATVFDATTGAVIDLDLRGSLDDVAARYQPKPLPEVKRGRPKLGVTAREVTLLPRHWEWLGAQPGGASVALRKLVEAARKTDSVDGPTRAHVEAVYRFMVVIAGDMVQFEEASRSLFAHDWTRWEELIRLWPTDVQDQLRRYLAANSDQTHDE